MLVGRIGAIGFAFVLSACARGSSAEWSPRDPTKEYPPKADAYRIDSPSELSDCAERIGSFTRRASQARLSKHSQRRRRTAGRTTS
jgi:hypothetical protein